MAIFSLGADDIRIKQMKLIAEAWGFVEEYEDPKKLLDDAKKKKFSYVLVVDLEALESGIKKELSQLGIEVINFNDKEKLEKLIKI